MSYKIKIEYITGDSFNSWETDKILDRSWKDAEIAKENLQRIKEHYDWYCGERYSKREKVKKPLFVDNEYTFRLFDDNRNEFVVCADWCGYFERLTQAYIITSEEDGWRFTV